MYMPSTVDKKLLFDVIDALPQEELSFVYRLFSSFIDDYLDSRLTDVERTEHLEALNEVRDGKYASLADLPD